MNEEVTWCVHFRVFVALTLLFTLVGCAPSPEKRLASDILLARTALQAVRSELAQSRDTPLGLYLCEADITFTLQNTLGGGGTAGPPQLGATSGVTLTGSRMAGDTLTAVFRSKACGATPEK